VLGQVAARHPQHAFGDLGVPRSAWSRCAHESIVPVEYDTGLYGYSAGQHLRVTPPTEVPVPEQPTSTEEPAASLRIAVIGAGKVGRALGGRWADVGHDVVFGVRDPADPKHADAGPVATPTEAVRGREVVVVALPWASVQEVVSGLPVGDSVVVDATNPLAADARELRAHPELSGAELVAEWTGSSRVVKAFNTTGAANMVDPSYPGGIPVMLIASDDQAAAATVRGLAADLGFDPVDAGPLSAATDLEHLAMIWIRLAYPLGNGPDIAFSLLRR
jgi:predicted dinucleotide-binding enzyme